MPEDVENWLKPNSFYDPENSIVEEWHKPIISQCSQCGYDFPRYDRVTEYRSWCASCFGDTPTNQRFKPTTPEDLRQTAERQAKTRQSLKQRALDRKNRKGLTVIAETPKTSQSAADELLAADMTIELNGDDVLIFNEIGED